MSTVLGSLAQVVLLSINVLFVCVRVRLGTARQKEGIELTVITKLKLNQLLTGVKSLLAGASASFEAAKSVSQDWSKIVVGKCWCPFEATKPVNQD